jgi:uracil-DNA glycosylase family 4
MARRRIITPAGGVNLNRRGKGTISAANAYQKRLNHCRTSDAIFPANSPGLPPLPPNSAFVSYVHALGDTETEVYEENVLDEEGNKKKVRRLKASAQLHELIRDALRTPSFMLPVEIGPHREKEATFVPGHLWGAEGATGPRQADVMILNKMPWVTETHEERCLAGEEGELLFAAFRRIKAKGIGKFYITHLVKFMPPDWKTNLKAAWVKDCMHLLHHELKIVQPKYILCLGSDACKALLGSQASITSMEGRVEPFEYNVGYLPEQLGEEYTKTAQVMAVIHPKQVLRDQAAGRQLEQGVGRFAALTQGAEVGASEKIDHRQIDNHIDLYCLLKEIEQDPTKEDDVIAVDAEWHGDHPVNENAYVRTIQFAWHPKVAAGVKLCEAGGEITNGFKNWETNGGGFAPATIELLTKFFNGGEYPDIGEPGGVIKFRKKRVVGHFFNADLEWFVDALGIDLRPSFACSLFDFEMKPLHSIKGRRRKLTKLYKDEGFRIGDTVPAWARTKLEGGADTGLMAHAIEETASYKLETLAMRYTTAPRYDAALDKWKEAYCKEKGLSSKSMEGYGECPDDVLLPYGIYDADVTLRLFYALDVLLDEDYEGNDCREAFWESQIATPAVLEIHRTGIAIDKARVDVLTTAFENSRSQLEDSLRQAINWPDFNIRSTQQVKEFLFGHKLNGKLDKETGNPVRIRPEGAMSLGLQPLFDTGKPPKQWIEIKKARKEHEHSPSTNKQVLSILGRETAEEHKCKLVNMVRDYRFLDQVLKTVLRPARRDDENNNAKIVDDDGHFTYEDGLASMACGDGKVRTHIYQTKETGRWSSARPNLQNISKQRDPDYKRLLGESYKYSLRSVLKASPGHVLVEADYVGAELFGMAVMAGDQNMIQHAMRNQLPEDHSDFYDIHSNVAVFAFKLKCPPTKSGLASIGKKHIRIVAKSVIFGIAYGRGAKAIAVAAKEQGIDITVDEAQAVIDAIFQMYPMLQPFFQECQERATGKYLDPETGQPLGANYLCNCYGRFRRFPDSGGDNSLAAEFERQAMNFPIQSMIASAVSRAIAYVHDYKLRQLKRGHDMFRILLQIHDAILLEVPYKYVKHVCEYVLPTYMREAVPIYPTNLDGIPSGDGPYTLGIEADVMNHWGELLTYNEATKHGLPTGSGKVTGCVVNYSHAKEITKPIRKQRSVAKASKARSQRDLKAESYPFNKKKKRRK